MGWLADRRARKRQERYEADLAAWSSEVEQLEQLLEEAETFDGLSETEADSPLRLKSGERVFAELQGVGLVESRRQRGSYQGGSRGVSIRVMKGVSYRVGAHRGTYTPGPEVQTVIDDGDVIITNQRAVFLGRKQKREWAYAKLLGVDHDEQTGASYLAVSNRQKVSGFGYGPAAEPMVRFRLSLAMAHFDGEVDRLVKELHEQLTAAKARRPQPPPPTV